MWTAKHLRRGGPWSANGGCDGRLKELLQVTLEEWADPAVVRALGKAFARYDEDET